MSLWPCLESGYLLPRGRAALRLPRLRRQNESKNDVNPARGDGQKIKKTLGGNEMKRRILAILLSLTMMFTLVPTAWAENNGITTEAELRTAIENATGEKNTITLAEDIGLASTLEIPADKHIEIQGDGHSI